HNPQLHTFPTRRSSDLSKESKTQPTVDQLKEKQAQAVDGIEKVLLERGINSELRTIINAELQPNYALNLSIRTAPGLAEVFDPRSEEHTSELQSLRHLV